MGKIFIKYIHNKNAGKDSLGCFIIIMCETEHPHAWVGVSMEGKKKRQSLFLFFFPRRGREKKGGRIRYYPTDLNRRMAR